MSDPRPGAAAARATPVVSVVVPAFRAAGHIGGALDSVLAQTFPSYEILVVNDGSPDVEALEEALAPYRAAIRYVAQENRGPGGARNTGILRARGEYVAFLDSDDRWRPRFLEEQVRVLRAGPAIDLVYADARITGASPLAGRSFMETCPSSGEVSVESLASGRCTVVTSCVVARRAALLRAGLFDPRFHYAEDFDLWIRLLHQGGRITYQRRVLAEHHRHERSLTANESRFLSGQVEVLEKLLRELALSAAERRALERYRDRSRALLHLAAGKRWLVQGEYERAERDLRLAHGTLGGRKLRAVILGLRLAPGLVSRLHARRTG